MNATNKLINGIALALACAHCVAAQTQATPRHAAANAPTSRVAPPADGVSPILLAQASTGAGSTPAGAPPADADDPVARGIVQKADEIRLPQDDFQVDVLVNTVTGGQAQEPRRYRVLSKGNENTIVMTTEPATERGQNLLMKGRELWLFMPSVSQPVRLSLSQRLTGQVSNGDLARANFSGDYTARVTGTEKIGGRDHHVLELLAKDRGVTYPKVVYWVRAGDHAPHKAEFYSVSGRLLKTCRYEQFGQLGGKVRPTRLVMTDALKAGDESVLEYSAMKHVDLPERMFTKDYLKKLD